MYEFFRGKIVKILVKLEIIYVQDYRPDPTSRNYYIIMLATTRGAMQALEAIYARVSFNFAIILSYSLKLCGLVA